MMFLAPGIVLGAVVAAAQVQTGSADQLVSRVNAGRQQLEFESNRLVRSANQKMLDNDFDGAVKIYRQIIGMLENYKSGTVFKKRIEFCQQQIKECYYSKAGKAIENADKVAGSKDFEAAINMCREAQKFCPERAEELGKKIEHYEIRRKAALSRENASIGKLAPGLADQEYKIQLLLEQGRALAGSNELTQARRKFEEVLLIDPFNAVAIQNMEGINNRIRKDAAIRAHASAKRMTAKVEWDAAIPIVADAPVGEPENQLNTPVAKTVESPLMVKLKSIRIPRFEFDEGDLTFSTLIEELRSACRTNDPSRLGVNFVVRGLDSADENEKELKIILAKKQITAYDLLNDLQTSKILTFKVDDNAVMIAPAGTELEDMEVRYFPYELTDNDDKDNLKEWLEAEGISFGKGSSVELLKARNLVIVRNTPENLKKIGIALEKRVDNEPMVQVMFKFIEVSQDDLDELGFNWNYQRLSHRADDMGNPNRTIMGVSSNELLRHYSTEDERYSGTTQSGTARADDLTYQFVWADSKNAFTAGVYALDWADSSDVLYSPRVTTRSNTTAKINMSEKHYYPEDWETADTESTDDFIVSVSPQPSLEDEQETGIKFEITPKADKKTGLIDMEINVPIKQFVDWLTVDARTGEDGEDGEYIKKPIFSERTLKTVVAVKDGDTVLVGGMAMDNIQSIHDKIPILGDIPFIGRFFQSKYVKSQKSHLLIFVTCRMIKPDGSSINPKVDNNGLPDFSRSY